jgi:hypothetical protein
MYSSVPRARHTADSVALRPDRTRILALPVRAVVSQRFWLCSTSVVDERSALARLSARFCLSDLPDFLLIVCRGDLSATLTP